jgi:hypothetical protein
MNEGHLRDDFDLGPAEQFIDLSKLEAAGEWGCAASWSSLSLRARRGVDSEDLDDRADRIELVEPLVGGGELERVELRADEPTAP